MTRFMSLLERSKIHDQQLANFHLCSPPKKKLAETERKNPRRKDLETAYLLILINKCILLNIHV